MTSPEQADEWDTFKAWVPAHWDRATTACAWSTWQERARLAAVALHPAPSEPEPVASIRWQPDGRHEVMWHESRPRSGWVTVYATPKVHPAQTAPALTGPVLMEIVFGHSGKNHTDWNAAAREVSRLFANADQGRSGPLPSGCPAAAPRSSGDEAVRLDAARYRWLRACPTEMAMRYGDMASDYWDKAIDAAMAKEQQP
jgi:hypothetical protein